MQNEQAREDAGAVKQKIRINSPDWDMSDEPAEERTVESFVMPLEGCGSDDAPAAVVDAYGRELRYIGVRRTGTRVELVVDTEVPAR
jgi:hypothetical protein